jgi:hypothetical protein
MDICDQTNIMTMDKSDSFLWSNIITVDKTDICDQINIRTVDKTDGYVWWDKHYGTG